MGAYGSPDLLPGTWTGHEPPAPPRAPRTTPARMIHWSLAAILVCVAVIMVAFTGAFVYFAVTSPPWHATTASHR
jgi:hypothetical protein